MKFTLILSILLGFFACSKKVKPVAEKLAEVSKPVVIPQKSKDIVINSNWSGDFSKMKTRAYSSFPEKLEADVVFGFKRGACYGKCPAWEIKIYNDGFVGYYGSRNVEKIGFFTSKIDKKQFDYLVALASEYKITSMNAEYPIKEKWIVDLPLMTTYVALKESKKLIITNYDAPKQLIEFESKIEAAIKGLEFVKVGE